MIPNCELIKTTNLNFCLFSSKTPVQQFKKDVSNSATKDSIMNAHNKTQLTHARSIVHSNTEVVTHHYQRFSSSRSCFNPSSSSAKVIKCPEIKNEYILTQMC